MVRGPRKKSDGPAPSSPFRVGVSFDGLSHVQEALDALSVDVQRRVLRFAMRKAARPIVERAQALAPVASGKLRDSIALAPLRRKKRTGIVGISVVPGKQWYTGDSYYAAFVEFGFKKLPSYRGKDGKWYTVHRRGLRRSATGDENPTWKRFKSATSLARFRMGPKRTTEIQPRPFLRPAMDQSKAEVQQIFRHEIAKGVARAAARLARQQLKASGVDIAKLDRRAIRRIARRAGGG